MIINLVKKQIIPANYIFKKKVIETKRITSIYSSTAVRHFSVWKRVIPRKPVRAVKKWQLRDKKRVNRIISWIKKTNRHILGQKKILATFYGAESKIKKAKVKPLAFFKMSKKRRIRKRYQSLLQKKKKPFLVFKLQVKKSYFFQSKVRKSSTIKRKNKVANLPREINKNRKTLWVELSKWKEKKAFLGKVHAWKKVTTSSNKEEVKQQLRNLIKIRTPKVKKLFQKLQNEENQKNGVALFVGEKLPKRWLKTYEKAQKIKKSQKDEKLFKIYKTKKTGILKHKKEKIRKKRLFFPLKIRRRKKIGFHSRKFLFFRWKIFESRRNRFRHWNHLGAWATLVFHPHRIYRTVQQPYRYRKSKKRKEHKGFRLLEVGTRPGFRIKRYWRLCLQQQYQKLYNSFYSLKNPLEMKKTAAHFLKLRNAGSQKRNIHLAWLERRLDVILCRLHLAPSIKMARAWIIRGYIWVNEKQITNPNQRVDLWDIVAIGREKDRFLAYWYTRNKLFKRFATKNKNNRFGHIYPQPIALSFGFFHKNPFDWEVPKKELASVAEIERLFLSR